LFSEEDLTRFFQILLQTDDDLRRKPDPRVHLEMGLLRLINAGRLAPLEELMAELRGGSGSTAASAAARSAGSAAPFVPSKREMASAAAAGAFSSAPREGAAPVRESFSASVTQPENAAPKVSVPSFAPPPEVDVPTSETASAPAKSAEPQSAKILAQGL